MSALLVLLSVTLLVFGKASLVDDRLVNNKFYQALVEASQGVEDGETSVMDEAVSTNSLRTVRDESRFLQGLAMVAQYSDSACSDGHSEQMFIERLNICVPESGGGSTKYRLWITQKNNFGITVNTWSDAACSQGYAKKDMYAYQNKCTNPSNWIVQNVHKLPDSTPSSFLPGFAIISYANQDLCSNTQGQGAGNFFEMDAIRMNHCYKRKNSHDLKISGCGSGGINWTEYSSTDGSCTGSETPHTWDSGNTCTHTDIFGQDLSPVYTKFHCFQ